jgi:hypothetical protein
MRVIQGDARTVVNHATGNDAGKHDKHRRKDREALN